MIDSSIIRHLIVKYKKLDTKNEFFQKISLLNKKNEKRKGKKFNKKGPNTLNKLSLFQKSDGRLSKRCPLSNSNAPPIDYKNVSLLRKYISDNGKILSSKNHSSFFF